MQMFKFPYAVSELLKIFHRRFFIFNFLDWVCPISSIKAEEKWAKQI